MPETSSFVIRETEAAGCFPLLARRAGPPTAFWDQALGLAWEKYVSDIHFRAFRHADGTVLTVKFATAKPSWSTRKPSGARWDMVAHSEIDAQIHVLAHHPVWDEPGARRDPMQWRFHVVGGRMLPRRQTLSLPAAAMLAPRIGPHELRASVERLRTGRCPVGPA